MDKTRYSNLSMIIIYFAFAFCWAGKNLLPAKDMLICGVGGIVLGLFVIICQQLKLPEYLCRGIGVFAAAIAIVLIDSFAFAASTNRITVIKCVYLPVASGAMFMDGLFIGNIPIGRTKAFVGSMSSVCLTISILVVSMLTKIDGNVVSYPVKDTATFIQAAFFGACVCCFLALSRHIKLERMLYIFPFAFICTLRFNSLSLTGHLFIASVVAGALACLLVGASHRRGKTGYLIILTPVIYACCPGGALHRFFVALFTLNSAEILPTAIPLLYNIAGLYIGVKGATFILNKIFTKKSQEFQKAY